MSRSKNNKNDVLNVNQFVQWIGLAVLVVILTCIAGLGYFMYRSSADRIKKVEAPFNFSEALLIDSRLVQKLRNSETYHIVFDDVDEITYNSCVNVSGNKESFISSSQTALLYIRRGETEKDTTKFGAKAVKIACDTDITFARSDVSGRSLLDVLAYPGTVFPWNTTVGIDGMKEGDALGEIFLFDSMKLEEADDTPLSVLLFEVPIRVKTSRDEVFDERVRMAAYSKVMPTLREEELSLKTEDENSVVLLEHVTCLMDRCVEITYSD